MNRRELMLGAGGALVAISGVSAARAASVQEIRIGYQKSGVLPLVKQQGRLEKRFGTQGIAVKWVEFPFGPPLLEALNVGSIDFGATGDAPPIFAQAAKANLLYVAAARRSGTSEAILVPQESPIKTLADLKGRKRRLRQGIERP